MKRIVYLPLDDRPCVYDFPVKLAEILNWKIFLPPPEFLGNFTIPGNFDRLFNWLSGNIKGADTLIIYLDGLIFGNLLASRGKKTALLTALKRAEKLKKLLRQNPQVHVFAYSIILRNAPSGESLWRVKNAEKIAKVSADISRQIKKDNMSLKKNWWEKLDLDYFAENYKIKKSFIVSYLKTRQRNFNLNKLFLEWLKEGVLDYLWMGSDDTAPASLGALEYKILKRKIKRFKLNNKVFLYNGTDEGSQLMLAFYATKKMNMAPKFFPVYFPEGAKKIITKYENKSIEKNLTSQLRAAGASPAASRDRADIILYVNCPKDSQEEALLQEEKEVYFKDYYKKMASLLNKDMKKKRLISLVDVAYANGADVSLVKFLEKKIYLGRLASFSAWNTAGNSIGTAISQSILYYLSSCRGKKANKRFLIERFLDDYIYQSMVRKKINIEVIAGGMSIYNLGENKLRIEKLVKQEMKAVSFKFLKDNFKREKFKFTFSLPWPRTFEIKVNSI